MQDRFKFRVFFKYNQIMYDIDSFCYLQGLNKCVFHFKKGRQKTLKNDEFILMQSTGLKDKNGELIYEGDIVQILDDEIPYIIEYEQDGAMFIIHSEVDKVCFNFDNYSGSELEVIGNIYENKELFNDRK